MQVGHSVVDGVQTVNSEGLPVTGTSTMNEDDVFPIGKGEFPASQG